MTVNLWSESEHAQSYLEHRQRIPMRAEGYRALLEFVPEPVGRVRARFAGTAAVSVVEHDLDVALPADWGTFDAVVSAFAIHHVVDARKRRLYGEVYERLTPGGVFLNLEHVASPTPELHQAFLAAIGVPPEDDDPSNQLTAVETQLAWLRDLGFEQVDCHWKWRELALLAAVRPAETTHHRP
jgi:SAM-dependent methyltransferase